MRKQDNHTLTGLYKLLLIYLFGLVIFTLFRIYYLISLGTTLPSVNSFSYVKPVLLTSIRYDTTVLSYVLAPLFISILVGVFYKKDAKTNRIYSFLTKKYSLYILEILVIISSFDFFFFKTYGTHFSPIIFGLKDDETSAILVSLWSEYPIIKLLIFWVLAYFIIRYMLRIIDKRKLPFHLSNWYKPLLIILFSIFYFIGMRGSLASHGLDLRHASVTDNQFLNRLTINPVFALKEAISKNEASQITLNFKQSLTANGFSSFEKAKETYLSLDKKDSITNDKKLFTTTPENIFLAKNPPNVVFILMESMSRHLFDLHSSTCNLLGDLEDELPYCYVFENTLSSGNLTIHSLENILTGTPYTPIAQSPYNNIPLQTSIVRPFQKAGYRSHFIYGGLYGWRNIGDYLKTQGFDEIITQKKLEKEYQNPSKFAWGLHDEYLYDKAWKLLQSKQKPQFLFLLTLSNHTPYDLPADFVPKPIQFPDSLYPKMRMDKNIVNKNLKAFQYANHQLGLFINKIRNSPLGANTIVVVTGDHNLHRGFKYTDRDNFLAHSVPIIFYIPKLYQPKDTIRLSNFGSHKDIFPTIYNIALSQASYFNTGKNILDNSYHFSVNDFTFAADQYGAVRTGDVPSFYQWTDSHKKYLKKSLKNNHLDSLLHRLKAYKAVMGYRIQKELSKHVHDQNN